jgi:hypothetical protein
LALVAASAARKSKPASNSSRSSVSTVTAHVAPACCAASSAKLRAAEKSFFQGNSRTSSLSPATRRATSRVSSRAPVSITRQRSTWPATDARASPMMSALLAVRVVETIMAGGASYPAAARRVKPWNC